jgi:hypothetical protein
MERIQNGEPFTPNSSYQTIVISSETDIQSKPNPNLEEVDDLVKQSKSDVHTHGVFNLQNKQINEEWRTISIRRRTKLH